LLISDYTMEAGVRGLRKCIDTLCRILAVKISSEPETKLTVTPETVLDGTKTMLVLGEQRSVRKCFHI
ncbi:MAG: hypothetical protein J6Z38_03855, partial [Lachnospiraceae bacterium]|nr:hypothetical protein [Lachnospiraceae bacterium]